MAPDEDKASTATVLLVTDADRQLTIRDLLRLVLPRASINAMDLTAVAEGPLSQADVALVDVERVPRGTLDALRLLRARGFEKPIVVVASTSGDDLLTDTAQSLGAKCITRSEIGNSPVELGAAVSAAMYEAPAPVAAVARARRIFAAGQAALSLQHSINNPLAGLLAEAQLLQLEELTSEQHEAVNRMVELCRRIVDLVRRLDALSVS